MKTEKEVTKLPVGYAKGYDGQALPDNLRNDMFKHVADLIGLRRGTFKAYKYLTKSRS